jgi:predicted type IV restriction endonuclease
MVDEKRRLERLIELQEMYNQLESKVKELKDIVGSGDDAAYIELEECVRILSEIKMNAKEAAEPTINH